MNIIIYICSTKIALIIVLMKTNDENIEKILFKEYYDSLDTEAKNSIRDTMMDNGMGYTTFYAKCRDNSFKELEFRELERITGKSYDR